jgi:signal recognition particle receptor subunit beta
MVLVSFSSYLRATYVTIILFFGHILATNKFYARAIVYESQITSDDERRMRTNKRKEKKGVMLENGDITTLDECQIIP